jgi:hypothetical protein
VLYLTITLDVSQEVFATALVFLFGDLEWQAYVGGGTAADLSGE